MNVANGESRSRGCLIFDVYLVVVVEFDTLQVTSVSEVTQEATKSCPSLNGSTKPNEALL